MILCGLALIAPTRAAEQAASTDLVAAWSFDEDRGRLILDQSGAENHLSATAGSLTKGVCGSGLELDSRYGYVSAVASTSLAPAGAITLEAWVKPHSLPAAEFATVIRKEGCYSLRFAGGRLGFVLWLAGSPFTVAARKTDWQADQWYHLAATYDGRQARIFVDGVEVESSERPQPEQIGTERSNCCIGSNNGQSRFPGVIDEVRIYTRALAPAEIEASRQRGLACLASQKDLPVAVRKIGIQFPVLKKAAREVEMLQDGFLWIDAEDFADYGGWKIDTQFVQFVGSAYLIAPDLGAPVADASTEFTVPKAGTYRLWVRAKNWYLAAAPGQFRVSVGGQRSGAIFGNADTEEWVWQDGGEFHLPAGRTRLVLHDLTGYYARCDALVLTTDLGYTPPSQPEELRRERSRLTGLPLEPVPAGEFDVIVVGGGAAGSCAALAAARTGARTALINDRPVLGGNASIELGVPINGAASQHANARESGIIEEAGRIKARYGYPKMSKPFELLAEKEENLKVFLNQRVYEAKMIDAGRIGAVLAVDTLTGVVTRYQGKLFVDATGDGWLGYFAGAKFRHGRESRAEFGESHAPEHADKINMSGCLMGELCLSYRAENAGRPTPYAPPAWAAKLPPPEQFGRRIDGLGGNWWLEREGTIDTLWQAEKSRDELIRISFGYWDFLKNRWPDRRQAENYRLSFVPFTEGKREGRRLVGDHTLTQDEVLAATMFPDRISYGGWPMDVHHARGIYSGPEGPFHCNDHTPIYSIPYRCLYSANIDNLMMAGRCISVTHIALGTVRVQGTLSAIGQATGTAAAMCTQEGLTPRELGQQRIGELQQTLLRDDQFIPGITNGDPRDLARGAAFTASSTASGDEFGREQVRKTDGHELAMSRAVMFPRGLTEKLETIGVLLRSDREEPVEVSLHVREAESAGDFSSTTDLAVAKAIVPPGKESAVEFAVDCRPTKPFVWIWLPKTQGVIWHLSEWAPLDSCRAYGGGEARPWQVVPGQYHAFYTQPPMIYAADYAPENVAHGVSRIVGKTPNLWASDPAKPMPQWIEMSFPSPTRINAAYLTFDTDMNAPFHTVPIVPECVRDYTLSCWDGSQWVEVARETGNFQRRRVHRFPTVATTKLRLTVLETNGHRSARVFEIRLYEE